MGVQYCSLTCSTSLLSNLFHSIKFVFHFPILFCTLCVSRISLPIPSASTGIISARSFYFLVILVLEAQAKLGKIQQEGNLQQP